MVDHDAIGDFYNRYPYPKADRIHLDLNLLDHIYYLGHSGFENPALR